MKKPLLIAAITALAVAIPASSAFASPETFQRFEGAVIGKAGTNAKPKAIGLKIHPFHLYGIAGGTTDTGSVNSGSVMETPFATVFANVYMDKALSFNTASFPGCPIQTALDTPDKCPAGSRVDIPSSASGLVRSTNDAPGKYVLKVDLEIKTFVLSTNAKGQKVNDTLGLRVVTPLATAIIEGKLGNATGSAKKLYGKVMRFTIPPGLIAPYEGGVSQLVDFNSGIKAALSKNKPLVGLGKCPSSKKLNLGYNGEYAIKPLVSQAPNFKIDQIGKRIDTKVACK